PRNGGRRLWTQAVPSPERTAVWDRLRRTASLSASPGAMPRMSPPLGPTPPTPGLEGGQSSQGGLTGGTPQKYTWLAPGPPSSPPPGGGTPTDSAAGRPPPRPPRVTVSRGPTPSRAAAGRPGECGGPKSAGPPNRSAAKPGRAQPSAASPAKRTPPAAPSASAADDARAVGAAPRAVNRSNVTVNASSKA